MKVNTDAFSVDESGVASDGVAGWDYLRSVISLQPIRWEVEPNAEETEVEVLHGVRLRVNFGCRSIVTESDSQTVIKAINSKLCNLSASCIIITQTQV
jgi:hypothetical protein